MTKAWKIISAVVIIVLLFGALCLITGGSTERVLGIFNTTYDIEGLKQVYEQAIQNAIGTQPLS